MNDTNNYNHNQRPKGSTNNNKEYGDTKVKKNESKFDMNFDDAEYESQSNQKFSHSEKVVAPIKRLKIESDESTDEDDIVFNSKGKNKKSNYKNYDEDINLDNSIEELENNYNNHPNLKKNNQNFDASD